MKRRVKLAIECPRCGDDEHLMANGDGVSFRVDAGDLVLVGMPIDVFVECCACSMHARVMLDSSDQPTSIEWCEPGEPAPWH